MFKHDTIFVYLIFYFYLLAFKKPYCYTDQMKNSSHQLFGQSLTPSAHLPTQIHLDQFLHF